jgi:hypothetical protein
MRSGTSSLLLLLAACSPRQPAGGPSQPEGNKGAPAASAKVEAAEPVASAPLTPPPPAEPKGSVRFVVQHVEAMCAAGVGANGKGHFTVGTDLLVEMLDEGAEKPRRDFVFCPKPPPGGDGPKPALSMWQNCKSYPSCKVVSPESTPEHVEVQCGNEQITLETKDGRTLLRGPFGERALGPGPMHVAPTKKERRNAMVDC